METLAQIKKRICETIERNRDAFIDLGHRILVEPETAFSEYRTAEKVRSAFAPLGLSCRTEQAITGLTADVRGKRDEATIALMGELDAILLPDYPYADKTTGAAHACGHSVQLGCCTARQSGL